MATKSQLDIESERERWDRQLHWQQRQPGPTPDQADRKRAQVTHTDEESTKPQIHLILSLCEELGRDAPYVRGMTRLQASEYINNLKADRARLASEPATDKQITFINKLMEGRSMDLEKRREARSQLDAGLNKLQASKWIRRLQELPTL